MKSIKTRLSFEEFGAHLLTTGDLDPVYTALNKCAFSQEIRNKWLTAYCAFYNAGFACWASEKDGTEYWDALMVAARNELPTPYGARWPRAKERRHFRGDQAIKGIADWRKQYETYPELMMDYISHGTPYFQEVASRAREHRSIGEWLSFKIVDLVDACMPEAGCVDQSNIMLFMYDAPKQSLLNRWREECGYSPAVQPKEESLVICSMVDKYIQAFSSYECPHKPGKVVDMFCLETIFCKYQSHLNGHYPLYNDIHEISQGLKDWLPHSENAKLFLENMPRGAP